MQGRGLELIPLIIGGIVGLIGLGLLFDAWTPDEIIIKKERRRAPRIERSRKAEALTGLGVLCMAAAFLGRDTWVYSVLAVIIGAVLLLLGLIGNWYYIGQLLGNRGPMRRRD
jgi:hypothetical protein